MPATLEVNALAAQVAATKRRYADRWTIVHVADTLRVYVTLTALGFAEVHCLRVDFGETLDTLPSVAFCDPKTHAEGAVRDWPAGLTQYFKVPPNNGPSGWICSPWTREGRAHHAEWRSYPWHRKRALWSVATAIQDILDAPGAYTGRAAA